MKSFFRILIFSLALATPSIIFCQQSKIDSLLSALNNTKEDTSKICLLADLSATYGDKGDLESVLKYANDCIGIAQDFEKGRRVSDNVKKKISLAYSNIGNVNYDKGNLGEALKCYTLSLQIRKEIGDKKGIASSYNNLGRIYRTQGNYPEALKNYYASLKIRDELRDSAGIGKVYGNIGILYDDQKNYSEALKCYAKALQVFMKINDKKGIANIYNYMGATYQNQNEYTKASENYSNALKIRQEIGDKGGSAYSLQGIALIEFSKKNYLVALEKHLIALKIREEIGDRMGLISSYINLGDVNIALKRYSTANTYLENALKLSKDINYKNAIRECYSSLTKLDSCQGDWKSAYEHHKQFTLYRDSLFNEENTKKSVQTQMNYEFDKKEAVMKSEQEKERAVAEEKSRKQKIVIWSVAVGLLLVVVFAGFVFRSLRVTRKQKSIIEVQKTEVEKSKHIIEEKNKDITDSINYAKRIQKAMLPHRKDIWEAFPQSFILFKPKDILSGDFYFFHQEGNDAFVAVADCTGHGIPASLVTMISMSKLGDAVSQSSDTSEILSLLNLSVKTALKQSEGDEATRDGMDIALCKVDVKNRIVKYAGANRPIWVIRNGQKTIEEIKATKKAIGGFTEDEQHFDTHEIKLQERDTFYLFSDGYADTFGQGGKKLTTKKFKELLLDIQSRTMKEQQAFLDDYLENWKAGIEAIDDVCIVGIRV